MRDLKVYSAPVIVPEQFRLTPEESDRLMFEGNEHTSLDVLQILYKAGFRAGQECVRDEQEEDYCRALDALSTARTMLESFENNTQFIADHPQTDELERILAKGTLERFQALEFVLSNLADSMLTLSPAD